MTTETSCSGVVFGRRRALSGCSRAVLVAGILASALVVDEIELVAVAYAEEISSYGIEEIRVMARRREESLQDIPVSVTALSTDDMEMRNMSDLTNVANFTPNLTFDRGSGNTGGSANAQVFIRGIGQADWLFTIEPGVGVYVDGVYFARQMGNALDLVDLERVEVLRGPQGTLFGKNTIGGAIQLISKKPTGETGGFIEGAVGSYNRMDVRGSADFAVTDTLAAKFSFAMLNRDGYVKRLIDDVDLGDINSSAARLQFAWKASDNVQVHVAADYNRRREESVPDVALQFVDNAFFLNLWNAYAGFGTYSSAFETEDPLTTNATGPSQSDYDIWGVSTTVDWQMSWAEFKSVTAYRETDAAFAGDADNSPLPYLEQNNINSIWQFTQEFQLSGRDFDDKLDWLIGAFYMREKAKDFFETRLGFGLFDGLEALPGPIDGSPLSAPTAAGGPGNPNNVGLDIHSIRNISQDTDSYAAFAHASYRLLEPLSVTAGIRYTREEKKFEAERILGGSRIVSIPAGTTTEKAWNAWSPKVGLEYHITDEKMLYTSVSRGFKSGGFNGRPASVAVATRPFDPETVWAYEAGFKTSWLDRRLLLNAAAFYSDYNGIQLTAFVASPAGGLLTVVDNAAKAKIKGFEFELAAKPTSQLSLNAALGYTDAEYTELAPGVNIVTLDSKFVKTPKWTYNVGAQYDVPVSGDSGTVTARVDWSYRSAVENNPSNIVSLRQDGFGLLSARIVYRAPGDAWEFAVFGTNLTDELYLTNGIEALAVFGTADGVYGRPREWGASAKFNF